MTDKNIDVRDMKLISSKITITFYKRIFPFIWFGVIGFFLWAIHHSIIGGLPVESIIVTIFITVILYIFVIKQKFDFVDEVWDKGDLLIVKNKNCEDQIPLANIINIGNFCSTSLSNLYRITLTLRQPCKFGKQITFIPAINFFSSYTLINELIERVDEAKRKTGASDHDYHHQIIDN